MKVYRVIPIKSDRVSSARHFTSERACRDFIREYDLDWYCLGLMQSNGPITQSQLINLLDGADEALKFEEIEYRSPNLGLVKGKTNS